MLILELVLVQLVRYSNLLLRQHRPETPKRFLVLSGSLPSYINSIPSLFKFILNGVKLHCKLTSCEYRINLFIVNYNYYLNSGEIRYRTQVAVEMAQATFFQQLRSNEDLTWCQPLFPSRSTVLSLSTYQTTNNQLQMNGNIQLLNLVVKYHYEVV